MGGNDLKPLKPIINKVCIFVKVFITPKSTITIFDFKGSPLGSDVFDYFPYKHDYTYKDIFTGFVFYKPLEKHVMRYGIPGIFDEAFKEEFIKRHRIKNEKTTLEEINNMIKDSGMIKESGYDIKERSGGLNYKQLIRKWLKK